MSHNDLKAMRARVEQLRMLEIGITDQQAIEAIRFTRAQLEAEIAEVSRPDDPTRRKT